MRLRKLLLYLGLAAIGLQISLGVTNQQTPTASGIPPAPQTNSGPSVVQKTNDTSQNHTNGAGAIGFADNGQNKSEHLTPKDLVVVSKSPDFFTFAFNTITLLLSVLTLLVGAVTGVGLTVVIKAYREQRKLEDMRRALDEQRKANQAELREEFERVVEDFKRTTFGIAKLQQAKRELRDSLADTKVSVEKVYAALQKTVQYPDPDCLRLYARALQRLEGNLDIVRLVRNGILQFSRNPMVSVSVESPERRRARGNS